VTAELTGLAMADAAFTVSVADIPARADDSAPLTLPSGVTVHAGNDGVDAVEFGFAAHRGTDVLSLSKSASGGELSRVMLALEVVLAASAEGTTMVFDEVDAGVGGRAAVQIGRRLPGLLERTRSSSSRTCRRSPHMPMCTWSSTVAAETGPAECAASTMTTASPNWRGCWPGWESRTADVRTPVSFWTQRRATARTKRRVDRRRLPPWNLIELFGAYQDEASCCKCDKGT
jgi:hypothetical protein